MIAAPRLGKTGGRAAAAPWPEEEGEKEHAFAGLTRSAARAAMQPGREPTQLCLHAAWLARQGGRACGQLAPPIPHPTLPFISPSLPSPHLISASLVGAIPAARYLARTAPPALALYGDGSPLQAVEVDTWLDWAGAAVKPGPGLEAAVATLDAALALRTVLVGSSLTAADLALWGGLQAIGQWTKLRKAAPHAARWHAHVGAAAPAGPALADEHGLAFRPPGERAAARAAAGLGGGDTGSFDVALPGAKPGAVTTRFPPEPSGYLHIGHAKAALLNDFFAKHYAGRLIVRFDDTNPAKESTEFRDSIIADLRTLGVEWAGGEGAITYTSDYFPQLLDLGTRLIKAGHLYADDTPVDRMREERLAGTVSACRGRSVEENLALWGEMQAGSAVGVKNCMRFKMDMGAANATLRDPVAYRCNVDTPHWRTGTTYKVRRERERERERERDGGWGGGWSGRAACLTIPPPHHQKKKTRHTHARRELPAAFTFHRLFGNHPSIHRHSLHTFCGVAHEKQKNGAWYG